MRHPSELAREVEEGLLDPLETAVLMKRMEASFEEAYARVRRAATIQYEQSYGKEEVVINGATIGKYVGRNTYDWKSVPQVVTAQNKVDAIKKKITHATKEYANRGERLVDTDTGEVIPIVPYTSGEDSITIKL